MNILLSSVLRFSSSFERNQPESSSSAKKSALLPLFAIAALWATVATGNAVAQNVRIVTTVAGHTWSISGNGGPAAQANINYSDAVAVSAAGNIYIADTYDTQVREINASTGVISVVAGTGQYGFSGDGQLAVNAQLSYFQDIAVDSAGNVYIADTDNNVVRKVSAATGIITTIAGTGKAGYAGDGGAATSAELNGPSAVAVDSSGNIYIGDNGNYIVREVAAATGIITTIAGTPGTDTDTGDGGPATEATIATVDGLALDGKGDLYIAGGGCDVRKITASTGIINTYAGDGQCDFTGTSGNSGNNGPATGAEFGGNIGKIALDSSGNLYIADYSDDVVREVVASTGIITTIAGNGGFGYSGDGGQAVDALLYGPEGVAVAPDGTIDITDRSNFRLRQISTSGVITTIAGNGAIGPVPSGVSATSAQVGVFGNAWPDSLYVDSTGNLYFADDGNNVIRKVTPAGVISTIAGTGVAGYSGDGGLATSAELDGPTAIAFDASGNLYIADTGNNVVRKVDASTGDISTYAGTYGESITGILMPVSGDGGAATSAGVPQPTGLAVDSAGNLYIAEIYQCVVRKVTTAGIISTYAGQAGNCNSPNGDGGLATSAKLTFAADALAIDSQGNLYIGDDSSVRKVTASTGIITTIAGTAFDGGDSGDGGPATSATMNQVYGLSVDSSGNIYIADFDTIREVDAAGNISTVAGQDNQYGYSGDGGLATSALASPLGVAADNSGNIYFSDLTGNRIRKVSSAGATQTAAATPTFNPPPGVFGTAPSVTLSTTTPGAQILYTLDGSTPTTTSALYSAPISLVDPVTLSAIAIAPGYSSSGIATGAYTTGQQSQTITFAALSNVAYGVAPITLSATASSGLPVSYSVTGPATLSGSTLAITGAGSVTVTASQAGNSDYTAAASVARSFTVAPAPLTVTANNSSMTVGGPLPVFSYTVTGFVNGDNVGNIAGSVFETTTATISSPPGTYPITFSTEGFTSANYTFTYVNGTLTVTAAPAPAITLAPASLTFAAQSVGSTSAAQTVTLTNSGTAALSITAITASANFAATNTCGASVAPSAGCSISVTFAPTAGGAVKGTLTVTDNASGSPQTISLNGSGSDVNITSTSTGITISSAGGSATVPVQIASQGSFSGAVNLTCSVAYLGGGSAQDMPTCSLSPAQTQLASGGSANATLTIDTTASSGSARLIENWLHTGGGALAALFFFAGLRRRNWRKLGLFVALAIITTGLSIGCSGGSSTAGGGSGGSTNSGTTAGNYTVKVTATSAADSSETVSLTIPFSVQ